MSTSSNQDYNNLKRSMTKRLRRISEYPYLRDDALSLAIRIKGIDYKDKFFTYKWPKFKDKIYGDGFDITQFDEFDLEDEVYRKSYPHPIIVKIKLIKLKRTHNINITDEQIEKEYKEYKKFFKKHNLKDPAFGNYYNTVFTNSNTSNDEFPSKEEFKEIENASQSVASQPETTVETSSVSQSSSRVNKQDVGMMSNMFVDAVGTVVKKHYKFIIFLLILLFIIGGISLGSSGGGGKTPSTEPLTAPPTEPPTEPPNPNEPVDCVGDWQLVAFATCTETCGGGTIKEEFVISQEAENGGKACEHTPFEARDILPCNTQPC